MHAFNTPTYPASRLLPYAVRHRGVANPESLPPSPSTSTSTSLCSHPSLSLLPAARGAPPFAHHGTTACSRRSFERDPRGPAGAVLVLGAVESGAVEVGAICYMPFAPPASRGTGYVRREGDAT
eukprot:scaffold72878_cov35-Tisochrysis_lutea.AAC.3